MGEETFEGTHGTRLFARTWRPEGKPRALVVVHHGFLAHSGLYDWTARRLVERGYAVWAHDMRGHGKSEGDRFWVERISDCVDDLHVSLTLAQSRDPGLKTFLLGHSAGGLVSTLYALDHPHALAGLVAEGGAFALSVPEPLVWVLKGVAGLFPRLPVVNLNPADFSRDPQVVQAMNDDPLIAHEVQPTKTVAELVRADERLKKEFPLITLPVLILHGTGDNVTNPKGSQFFYDTAGSTDKTLKLYEGHVHDLLSDYGKETVMADIKAWIDARLPAAA